MPDGTTYDSTHFEDVLSATSFRVSGTTLDPAFQGLVFLHENRELPDIRNV